MIDFNIFRKAFGALSKIFEQDPDMVDFNIFRAMEVKDNSDIVEGFVTCLQELKKTNPKFKSIFSVDDNNKITLSSQGASRFIEYWSDIGNNRDSTHEDYEDFTLSVIYLGFLQKQGILGDEVVRELSESSKEILLNDILHKRYGLNPPIDDYPLSQLQLLKKMRSMLPTERGFAPAILKLREIGVIDDSYVSKKGDLIEKAFSDSYKNRKVKKSVLTAILIRV